MEALLRILKEMHEDIDFETHTTLIDDKIIDSFDVITLVAEIDDSIGITIPPEEIIPENFNSYKALSALIERLEDDF